MEIRLATKKDMPAVFALRHRVFTVEQGVPSEIEFDCEDEHALHIIAEENGEAMGCARLILTAGEAHMGRLAVKHTERKKGVGSAICLFILDYCKKAKCHRIWLDSQLHAVGFYEKIGFLPEGDVFEEAGISHVRMSQVTACSI